MTLLVLSRVALAASLEGERCTWDLTYAGVVTGQAWAEVKTGDSGSFFIEGGVKNADWYASIYTIDDWVRSTWNPGTGSGRYETRFREGRFWQDQDMHLGPTTVDVWRKQYIQQAWKEWTTAYDAYTAGLQDPVSAIYLTRTLQGDGPWTYPVFSGKETWPLTIELSEHDTVSNDLLGKVPVRVLELKTLHKGDLQQKGRFLLSITDDDRRIPVRMVVKTNFGSVRADLVEYTPPKG